MHPIVVKCVVVLICLLMAGTGAHAVLVYNGTATNLSAPMDDPGWDAVATISNGSATAIFLGNNGGHAWFLTANHVDLRTATLSIGGSDYTVFSNITQIGSVDLKVFRLDSSIVGITPVTLSTSTPSVSAEVLMIGNGVSGTHTTWDIPGGNSTWTSPGSDAEGYTWSGPNVKRWGTNTVFAKDVFVGPYKVLVTDFDAVDGEAQGSIGDSGGAVFHKNGGNWELVALMITVGRVENNTLYGNGFVGQPANTSVAAITGNPNDKSVTYSIQIADYQSEILATIPEPSAAGMVGMVIVAFIGLFARRRKTNS